MLLEPFRQSNFLVLLFFIITQLFLLAYTFVLNDVGDKDLDIRAGKIKPIQGYSYLKIVVILSTLAAGSLFIPLYSGDFLVKVISVTAFLLLTFYSLEPLRFKEKGIIGIIIADAAQRSILFLIFGLFISAKPLLIIFFMGWLFIIGFQDELDHQLVDIENDEKSVARTWVRQVGYRSGKKVLITFLVVSLIYLLFTFLFLDPYVACVVSITLFIFRFRVMGAIYYKTIFQAKD